MILIITYHFAFNFVVLCFSSFNISIVNINNIFLIGLQTKTNRIQCFFIEFKRT